MNRLILAAVLVLVAASSPAQDKPGAAPMVVFTLEKGGDITFEFFPADAPKHVENFLKLVKSGFYDGQRFHRVEPGFVVQIGDPQSKTLPMNDPRMGTGGPGYTLRGWQLTDANGAYRLETVIPGLYPGRTEHIHFKVTVNGQTYTSQLFFPGVSQTASDSIYSSRMLVTLNTTTSPVTGSFTFVVNVA